VDNVRHKISDRYGFPGESIMVSATHSHAGPAVANIGDAKRDDAYLEFLEEKIVEVFGQAFAGMQEAEVGFGRCVEKRMTSNRRVVMRDGTTKCQQSFANPDTLYVEGPTDPELVVLAARDASGDVMGTLVNYASHPTHYGPTEYISAGYPGVLAAELKSRGCPVTLFLQGACGNQGPYDPYNGPDGKGMEEIGRTLTEDVDQVLSQIEYRKGVALDSRMRSLQLPFRSVSEEEARGDIRGAQRFIDPTIYDRTIPGVLERFKRMGSQPAEVQALSIDEYSFVAIPAEYFVQPALRIKEEPYPRRAVVVGYANGMIGYVPHAEAFKRGGYETTFTDSSRMAPETGDLLADCAIGLVKSVEK